MADQNAVEVERLLVRLVGDGSSFQTMLASATQAVQATAQRVEDSVKKIEGMGMALKGIGATILGFLGIKSAFSSFQEIENGQIRLKAAITANGGAVDATLKLYREFAAEMKNTMAVGVGETTQLLKMAETFGLTGAAAQGVVKNAIALGAATDNSAEAMIRFTAAMAKGDTATAMHMGRMIPQLRGIHDQAQFVTKANQLLGIGFQTAGELANSTSGILKRFWDTLNTVGGKLSKGILDGLQPAIKWVVGGMDTIARSIQEAVKTTSAWIKGNVTDFVKWIEPVFKTLKGTLVAVWEAVKTAATVVWIVIKGGAEALWGGLKSLFGMVGHESTLTWNLVRDTAITALLMLEFGLKNLMPVTNLVMAYLRLKLVEGFNVAVFYLTEVVPAALNWFKENWFAVWYAIAEFIVNGMDVLGANIVVAFRKVDWAGMWQGFAVATQSVLEWAGNIAWKQAQQIADWFAKAITGGNIGVRVRNSAGETIFGDDASQAAIERARRAALAVAAQGKIAIGTTKDDAARALQEIKPFVLPIRAPGNLENQLREEFERQRDGAKEAWEEFRKRRLQEIMGGDNEAAKNPEAQGDKWGTGWAKGAAHGVDKLESHLRGSAGAIAAIQKYMAQITEGPGKPMESAKKAADNVAQERPFVAKEAAAELQAVKARETARQQREFQPASKEIVNEVIVQNVENARANVEQGDQVLQQQLLELQKATNDILNDILQGVLQPPQMQAANVGGQ